jgi:hypothetical protein
MDTIYDERRDTLYVLDGGYPNHCIDYEYSEPNICIGYYKDSNEPMCVYIERFKFIDIDFLSNVLPFEIYTCVLDFLNNESLKST